MKTSVAPQPAVETQIVSLIKSDNVDFIDFGCSKGGSLAFAKQHLGGKIGLGLDINPVRVEEVRALGHFALESDLTKIRALSTKVKFVIMSHFLEHVPSTTLAKGCLRSAINSAEDFIYIQQPFFDADPYLFRHGLKLFWSDWHGHPNRMTTLEFHNILNPFLEKGQIKRFAIFGKGEIKHSKDPSVHAINSPEDQSVWIKGEHPPKVKMSFSEPVFKEIRIIINLGEFNAIDHYAKTLKMDHCFFDSASFDRDVA